MLEIYLISAPELIGKLATSLRDGCHESIRDHAHSLKSSSGNIGARKIFELAAAIENLARDQQLEGVEAILAEIEALFPATCDLLEREIRRPAA